MDCSSRDLSTIEIHSTLLNIAVNREKRMKRRAARCLLDTPCLIFHWIIFDLSFCSVCFPLALERFYFIFYRWRFRKNLNVKLCIVFVSSLTLKVFKWPHLYQPQRQSPRQKLSQLHVCSSQILLNLIGECLKKLLLCRTHTKMHGWERSNCFDTSFGRIWCDRADSPLRVVKPTT